jgi:DNA-binding SARP family transcriptional activator
MNETQAPPKLAGWREQWLRTREQRESRAPETGTGTGHLEGADTETSSALPTWVAQFNQSAATRPSALGWREQRTRAIALRELRGTGGANARATRERAVVPTWLNERLAQTPTPNRRQDHRYDHAYDEGYDEPGHYSKNEHEGAAAEQVVDLAPAPSAAPEATASTAAASSLELLDLALRVIGDAHSRAGTALPGLRFVRMTLDQVELFFAEEVTLPSPWEATSDAAVWLATAEALAQHLSRAGDQTDLGGAPFPALVCAGHDNDGGLILLNLDLLGSFAVTGAPNELSRSILNGLVLEIATSPWSSQIQLEATDPHPDPARDLEWHNCHQPDHQPRHRLVVIDREGTVTPQRHRELREAGTIVITNGWAATEFALTGTSDQDIQLMPFKLGITPQIVDDQTYHQLRARLDGVHALQPPGEQGTYQPDTSALELHGGKHGDLHASPGTTTPRIVDAATHVQTQTGAAARSTSRYGESAQESQADGVHTLLRTGHPVVRLLGPVVDVIGAHGRDPGVKVRLCTRIAAYLALHPNAGRQGLIEAVWGGTRVGASTVDPRISNVRSWLGSDPETGEKYLPARSLRFTDSVTTDWAVLKGLVSPSIEEASTNALEQALELVRGRPLEGERSREYGFAEHAMAEMFATIADIAHELALRRLRDTAWPEAARVAALGIYLDPGNEHLWRIRIHVAHAAGNRAEALEAIARMQTQLADEGGELEPETTDLIQAIESGDRDRLRQLRESL